MASRRKLSARTVETERSLGYHADAQQPGLYLQVTEGASGITKSWVYRFTSPHTATRREMGLGPVALRPLADARALAAQYSKLVLDGFDPVEERRKATLQRRLERGNVITFDDAAKQCIAAKAPEWRNEKHAQQWTNTLATYASPVIGSLPVSSIDTAQVMRVLEPIWISKTETATRVRQRIEKVIDWAKASGYFKGDNPARLEGNLRELLPRSSKTKKVRHHPAVPFREIGAFMGKLREHKGVSALGLEFLISTATRTKEVTEAPWEEIDLDGKVWVIPANRMKAQREHRVPLNKRALQILREMLKARQGNFIFPGQRSGVDAGLSNAAFLALMKDMDGYAQYVPHGFRSSFRDWAAENTSYPNETVEICLAHAIKNQTEAAYRRGDQLEKRAQLMADWGAYLELPSAKSGKVIPLRATVKNK